MFPAILFAMLLGPARFNNMFYMKVIELSSTLGQELPYIVGLQTELPFGKRDLAQLAKNTKAPSSKAVSPKAEDTHRNWHPKEWWAWAH